MCVLVVCVHVHVLCVCACVHNVCLLVSSLTKH